MPGENIKMHFLKTIEFIEEGLKNGTGVLVHCAAGISRSGAVICAYLMWKNGWTFEEALKFGQSKRGSLHPNEGFQRQLLQFEEELKEQQSKSV